MSKLLDQLLKPEIKSVRENLPEAEYRVKRLSEACGEDVIFRLRALPYGKVEEIKEMSGKDSKLHIVLEGMVEPNFRAPELKQKFGGETPFETMKALLLPGEIEDLARGIEKLTGYRENTIEEIKKPSANERGK